MVATDDMGVLAGVLRREQSRWRTFGAVASALLAHAGLAALALHQHAPLAAIVDVTEVDFMPAAVAPKPEPEPPPPEPEPEAKPLAARQPATRPQARAPKAQPPASAAALHTVDEGVKTADEPVRFVTDPNGTAFGFGTVQRGGTARSATGPVAAAPAAPEPGPVPTTAPSLSRPPKLGESDPCRGYFPEKARVDRGEVALRVRVESDGSVRSISVSNETPMGHGFGFAARDCLRAKRFTPALDLAGKEVAVVSPITVRFSR